MSENKTGTPLLSVKNLTQNFKVNRSVFAAVRNVSFEVERGETFGLVGESGSGKTTTGRAIMGINKISGGRIIFREQDIAHREDVRYKRRRLQEMALQRRGIQMVFQDPLSSLNPRMTIREIIIEVFSS